MTKILVIIAIGGLVQWGMTHPDSEMSRAVKTQVERVKSELRNSTSQVQNEVNQLNQKLKK